MPIDFPNAPTNGATFTDIGITWQYSSADNSWTMITFGDPGISNGTDLDNTVVTLNHVGGAGLRNLPVAATGMKYDPAVRTFSITMTSGQTANVVELKNNAGTTLNSFNARGILDKAGKIYYGSTAPTVDAADIGQLWCNPTANYALTVWDGTNWIGVNQAFGSVTLDGLQIITGTKTFNPATGNGFELAGLTSCIAGSGANKAIVFKPTNASSVAAETLRLTSTAALFASGIELDFYVLGSHALGVVCSLATSQTITALKTFTANIQMGGSDNKIFANDSTTGNAGLEDLSLCANLATNSRYIKVDGNAKAIVGSSGITINAKNADGIGKLTVIGDQSVQGSLSITGNLSATGGIYAQSTIFCSVSGGGGGSNNISYPLIASKYTLGPLEIYVSGTNIVVSNTKPTPVRFFYKIEQGSTFGIQLCTVAASSSINLALTGNTAGSPVLVGSSPSGVINTSTSTTPAIATITLVN